MTRSTTSRGLADVVTHPSARRTSRATARFMSTHDLVETLTRLSIVLHGIGAACTAIGQAASHLAAAVAQMNPHTSRTSAANNREEGNA